MLDESKPKKKTNDQKVTKEMDSVPSTLGSVKGGADGRP